jgi:hypothetical protein
MNPRKKTAIIYIKTANGGRLIVNPNDLKHVVMVGTTVTFVTSVASKTVQLSAYAVNDKLKPMLRQRYNVVDVEANRAIKRQENGKSHNLTVIHEPDRVTCVFPKALRGVALDDNSVTIHGFNAQWTLPVLRQSNDPDHFETVSVA